MLERREVLFLKSWGRTKSGGRPSKNLAEIQAEYLRLSLEDKAKIVRVREVSAKKGNMVRGKK